MQAWFLRKCMTIYNDIVRRAHLPREHEIRGIMSGTGLDLTAYGPCSEESLEATALDHEEGEAAGIEEDAESEANEEEDDPCS